MNIKIHNNANMHSRETSDMKRSNMFILIVNGNWHIDIITV